MGYSSRYHTASLAAVFVALAIGILIGVGLGDSVVSDTEESLSSSLQADIDEARSEADELAAELEREREFVERAFPALVGGRLDNRRIGLLAFGGLPPDLASDIEAAIDRAEGELAEVSVVRVPPEVDALVRGDGRAGEADSAPLREVGARLGRQFVRGGGPALRRLRDSLFVRSSGEGGRLRGIVLAAGELDEADLSDGGATEALVSGLVEGVRGTGVPVVAVERTTTSPSMIPFFSRLRISTVDNVDSTAGRVATVFALLGADGDFGTKPTAESLLPELLVPTPRGGGAG